MLSRRTFLRAAAAGVIAWPADHSTRAAVAAPGERLYNGITLGSPWPPRRKFVDEFAALPPYLREPPAIVPIDVGRQLFVDDFLIEETNLQRRWHHATYHPASPVLTPDRPWERNESGGPNSSAMVFSDGVFFDAEDRLFKMWYMADYGGPTCLATSTDGIGWTRRAYDVVPGTNVVNVQFRDSNTVWLDHFEPDRRRRFKMAGFYKDALLMFVSHDGIHWTSAGSTPFVYDRTTFFHNPFRKVWCFSLRAVASATGGRYRSYWESPRFSVDTAWNGTPPVPWVKADTGDHVVTGTAASELYNLDCAGYESLMLGLFSIWRGESDQREKINEIVVGFSRDGFHWYRPHRESFIPVSNVPGSWNWGNVQSAGGGCLVIGDQLYFYVSGRAGVPGTHHPGVCSTGLATLRRDGFASMDWRPSSGLPRRQLPGWSEGVLTTRPVRFSGTHLFVNVDLGGGELRTEVLDMQGRVLPAFSRSACEPVQQGGTRQPVSWRGATLADLAGQPVRFRFTFGDGSLYAFWVSNSPAGHSNGYPAAGGPEFSGPIDRAGG